MTSFIGLIACCIMFVSVEDTNRAAEQEALKKFQGSWRLTGGEEVGTKISPDDAKKENLVFTFQGDSLIVKLKGKVLAEFVLTANPGKQKGTLDLKHKAGKYEGNTCHAIFTLDGDVMKICTASKLRSDKAEDWPTVFSTEKSDKPSEKPGLLLFILHREKP